jgi:glycosyltransferase involved in cell wall biosynthesis
MYDYLIITELPVFYKINLYNELSKRLNIFVIFIANDTIDLRSSDFSSFSRIEFDYDTVGNHSLEGRSIFSIIKILKISSKLKFRKILLCAWNYPETWILSLFNKKDKNCFTLESTINESITKGLKGWIKKIFLHRVSTVFASGEMHIELLKELNYKGNIEITHGVGIINKPNISISNHDYGKRYLYIGRLNTIKNLDNLISIFNNLDGYFLTIVGSGKEEKELKKIANKNINFINSVKNTEIYKIFNKNDIFILPSLIEPWGLVVEEALYFNTPVIISKNCGARDLIENDVNGYLIDPLDVSSITKAIMNIDISTYERLKKSTNPKDINKKDKHQIQVYSNVI